MCVELISKTMTVGEFNKQSGITVEKVLQNEPFLNEDEAVVAILESTKEKEWALAYFYDVQESALLSQPQLSAIMSELKEAIQNYCDNLISFSSELDCAEFVMRATHHANTMKCNVAPLSFSPLKENNPPYALLHSMFSDERCANLDKLAVEIKDKQVQFTTEQKRWLLDVTPKEDVCVIVGFWENSTELDE